MGGAPLGGAGRACRRIALLSALLATSAQALPPAKAQKAVWGGSFVVPEQEGVAAK